MSRPVCPTVLREEENRRVSPSSAHSAAAVISPTPLGLQRPAAGLAAGERGDLLPQRHQFGIEGIEDPQRGGDRLLAGGGSCSPASSLRRLSAPSRSPAIA